MPRANRRRPLVPCGPGAPAPAPPATSRREKGRFGLRDRAAAVLQDVRDLREDAPSLLDSSQALAGLAQAEDALRRVLNDLEGR